MKDETYAFISDVKEKKVTARSARHTRTHCGKGGRVRLPSDNLSKKELLKMSGECKSYRLNEPMNWQEFKAMPDDIKVTYINLLREKYNVPDKYIGAMFGVSKDYIFREFKKMGLQRKVHTSHPKWDKEGFWAWVNRNQLPEPVTEEPAKEEPEVFMEDDLPFDMVPVKEPDPIYPKLPELHYALCAEIDGLKKRVEELLKTNEELMAANAKYKEKIAWLEVRTDELGQERHLLEAQMEVVRMIFGGKNNA